VIRSSFAAIGVCLFVAVFAAPAFADPHGTAVLQTLDKVTARVSTIDVGVERTVRFGTLLIKVQKCDKRPPEETPESTVFLEISEQRPGESPVLTFAGWMFSSSPALNALEHPVYDVWVIDCKDRLDDDSN
jgi:hypothetical protein